MGASNLASVCHKTSSRRRFHTLRGPLGQLGRWDTSRPCPRAIPNHLSALARFWDNRDWDKGRWDTHHRVPDHHRDHAGARGAGADRAARGRFPMKTQTRWAIVFANGHFDHGRMAFTRNGSATHQTQAGIFRPPHNHEGSTLMEVLNWMAEHWVHC